MLGYMTAHVCLHQMAEMPGDERVLLRPARSPVTSSAEDFSLFPPFFLVKHFDPASGCSQPQEEVAVDELCASLLLCRPVTLLPQHPQPPQSPSRVWTRQRRDLADESF